MSDIFISYSRKDSSHALALAEQLRSNGIEVWIDQHGIGGAEKWATEIAEGIRACSTFLLLISEASVESENVLKELSLASEKRKRILPVDIQPASGAVTLLPTSFEYSLAGLQRVAISDFEGILQAHKHGVSRVTINDSRKSLIVLPFEDLSPTGEDNAWFADGLAGEMIDSLGHIKSLRLIDRKTSMDLKGFRGKTMEIAEALHVRYFIEGTVRKFGEQIKISIQLLDIETGDYLWQESHKGKFEDIFEIQEAVAEKVVEGLKLHLTKGEKAKVMYRGTENAEAYELLIKAVEYANRHTKEGVHLAIQLSTEAIKLDGSYVNAYQFKAHTLAVLYRNYTPDPALLEEGMKLVREALRLKPDLWRIYSPLSFIYQLQGHLERAEETAKQYIKNAPQDPFSHFALGIFYLQDSQFAKAIAPLEQAVKLNPEDLVILMNLVVCCQGAKEEAKQIFWAEIAIPRYERHLKLFPDDENARVDHAGLLYFAGKGEEARETARQIENIRDGKSLYNIACLQCMLKDFEAGVRTFRKSIEAGFRFTQHFKEFLNDEKNGIGSLKGTPEYEEVKKMVEKIEAESAAADGTNKEAAKDNG